MKGLLAVLSLVVAFPAFARPGVSVNLRTSEPTVQSVLEAQLGQSLTAEQSETLQAILLEQEQENLLVTVADSRNEVRSAICGGVNGAAMVTFTQAICVTRDFKVYEFAFTGAGLNVSLNGTIFRLAVSFDSSRYSKTFDPLPGTYGGLSVGITVPMPAPTFSGTTLQASSGNKKLVTSGILSLGFGVDLMSVGAIVIR